MELRGQAALLTAEVVAVIACAIAPLPVPAVIPLLVIASMSLYLRGQGWADRFRCDPLVWRVGAITGAIALVLALVVVGPLLERQTGGMVGWSRYAMVRGKPQVLVTIGLVVVIGAICTEAVLRGWVLDRVRALAPGRAGLVAAIAITALVEAVFTGGAGWSGLGAAVFGAALSGLYLAGGRSLVAPVVARLTFELGLLVLEALKVVN